LYWRLALPIPKFRNSASICDVLKIRIENFDRLPNGGPLEYEVDQRGFDFGRDSHLDWMLPDKGRIVSGKHCEVRFYDDAYWLVDVSTNGTFVNGSTKRVQNPYQLNEGDRLQVGEYVLSITINLPPKRFASVDQPIAPQVQIEPRSNIWDAGGSPPPPLDVRELMPKALPADIAPDYLNQALYVPQVETKDIFQRPQPAVHGAWSVDDDQLQRQPDAAPTRMQAEPVVHATQSENSRAEHPLASKTFVRNFSKGAGLPDGALDQFDDGQLAEMAGHLLQLTCGHLMSLLQARAEAKAISRSGGRTMVKATENNPLKFLPTSEEALLVMLSPRGKSYLNAQETLDSSFTDLKHHHFALLAAMQATAVEFFNELSPEAVEKASGAKKSLLGGGKGKMWDDLVKRWAAKTRKRENGMLDAFLDSFAQHYDEFSKTRR
jgi:type VI secretion system protein ImpI